MPVFGANVQGKKGMIPPEPGLLLINSMGLGHVMKLLTFPEQGNITVNQALSLILFLWIMLSLTLYTCS